MALQVTNQKDTRTISIAQPAPPKQPISIVQPKPTQKISVVQPAKPSPIPVQTKAPALPEIQVDNSPRFVRLGEAVKTKFPGVYDSYESGALGKIVATKYPDVYKSLIDPAVEEVATPQPRDSDLRQFLSPAIGGLKGLGSTILNIGKLGSSALGAITGLGNGIDPNVESGLKQITTPKNIGESIGKGIEQVGEFFIPSGAVGKIGKAIDTGIESLNYGSKTTKALQLGGKIALGATEAGTISKAQGQSNKDAIINAGLGGAAPLVRTALSPFNKSVAGRFVNSLIKPKEVDFRFGKNPGLAVAEEGITANTLNGLKTNISKVRQNIGQEIEKIITAPKVSNIVQDITPAFAPIDEAINSAVNSGEQEYVNRLLSLKNGLTKTFKLVDGKLEEAGLKKLTLTPKEIQQLKIKVGEGTRWTGQAFDSDINQVKTKVYSALNDLVEKAAPGTKKLNQKYGNLLTAEKAVEKRAGTVKKNNLISLPNIGFGGIGAVAGTIASGGTVIPGLAAGAAAVGTSKVLGSTAVKSRVAKQLAKPAGKGFGLIRKTYSGTRKKD
jgi:hypothetical protein